MVKIWGSSKNDKNWTIGKSLKLFIFTSLHFIVVVVVVVVVLIPFQLTYLKNARNFVN